jgi:uncharacterized protein YcbK (DUF882 family)/LysM repeat protein
MRCDELVIGAGTRPRFRFTFGTRALIEVRVRRLESARMTLPHARVFPPLVAAILIALAPVYPGTASAAEMVHVVARGQTLGAIARKYHVPVTALREANGLKSWQQIHPGLSLTIPGAGGAADAKGKADPRGKADPKGKRDPKSKAEPPAEATPREKGARGAKGRKEEREEKAEATMRGPKRPGFVRMMRGTEKLEAQLLTRRGRLVPAALPGLGRVLRYYPTNEKIPIDPRLATLIGLVSDHFGGRTMHITSGYRPYSPVQYAPHSNHNLGRAMDFSVEGVSNTELRDFCRTFRNAGVGYYPNGSFVHLDVRTTKTTWIDYSRSGEAPKYEGGGAPPAAGDAAGENEPHEGAEPVPGGADPAPGSVEPQGGPVQAPDSTGGN